MKFESLSGKIIGCAIEVHRHLGPGLLESAYEHCMSHELSLNGISFKRQLPLPVEYKEVKLDCGYKIDLIVENKIIIELKSVLNVLPVHKAQLLTYMKLTNVSVGLLMNFNVEVMKKGIDRFVF